MFRCQSVCFPFSLFSSCLPFLFLFKKLFSGHTSVLPVSVGLRRGSWPPLRGRVEAGNLAASSLDFLPTSPIKKP